MVSDLCMILSVNKHSKIDTNAIIDKAKKRYFSSTPLPSPFGGGAQSVGVVAPLAAGRSPTKGGSGCSRESKRLFLSNSHQSFSALIPFSGPCLSRYRSHVMIRLPEFIRRGVPPRFAERTAEPTAGKFRYAAGRKHSAGHTDRRDPKKERKTGVTRGVVVGVAACRHSGGVNIPQGNIRKV